VEPYCRFAGPADEEEEEEEEEEEVEEEEDVEEDVEETDPCWCVASARVSHEAD
jgi:hypothetical protein